MKRPKKATNREVNRDFLRHRAEYAQQLGYSKQKWVEFCELMIDRGYKVLLYEARQTVSKYVTVCHASGKQYKVRFSNHMPIKHREANGDCDFFVGRTHLGVSTTTQAIGATLAFFKTLDEPFLLNEHQRTYKW